MKVIWSVLDTVWTLPEKRLRNGTVLKKGANGTENTGLKSQKKKQKNRKLNSFVFSAGKSFTLQVTAGTRVSIAQWLVAPNTVETMESTMKPESVQCVEKSLGSIDSAKQKLAVENAGISVAEIREEKTTADVYNLTVDEEHEYFANGFLVHNCMDACIYACLQRPWTPVKKEKSDKVRDKLTRSAWTY